VGADPYYVHAKDIMKVLINNEFSQSFEVKLKATVFYFDVPKVMIESKAFNMTLGSNMYDLSAELSSLNWHDLTFRDADLTNEGLFPGNYRVCYELFGTNPGIPRQFIDGKLCENFNIEFPTPLLLAYPFDKAELEDKNPILSWIAPMPAGLESSIIYKMLLYENKNNLSKGAVVSARPIGIVETNSTTTNLPATLPELQQGITYFWRVDAYLGRNYLVSSDVWEFKLKEPKKIVVPEVYVKLNELKEDIHTARNVLRVIYNSDKTPGTMNYKITNPADGRTLREGSLNYGIGESTWEISIKGLNLENQQYLIIDFSNPFNNYSLKFLPLD